METKEAVRATVVLEPEQEKGELSRIGMAGPMARADLWTTERIELLKRACTPQECSDDEFRLFLEQCKHTGLNPFLKQAYLIERSQNIGGRWVKRFEFQAAEVGMAARANEFPDFHGMRGAAVYSKDIFEIDAESNKVTHKFSPNKDRGSLVGAWASIHRDGHFVPVTYLPLASRIQTTKEGRPTKFWTTMPEGQIAKCARAEQYRLAYPHIFSGVYIQEEMPEGEDAGGGNGNGSPPPPREEKNGGTAQRVREHVQARASQARPAPPADDGETLQLGSRKGTKVSELNATDLSELSHQVKTWLAENANHSARPRAEADLEKLRAEMKKRAEELAAPPLEPPAAEPQPEEPAAPEPHQQNLDVPF